MTCHGKEEAESVLRYCGVNAGTNHWLTKRTAGTKDGTMVHQWVTACAAEVLKRLWPEFTDQQREHALTYVNAGMPIGTAGNMVEAIYKDA